ncbi:WD40-repeat-containing domain protein [Chiua virens]|nr:WD40-repeat-containing domain protein [Chiua virens]
MSRSSSKSRIRIANEERDKDGPIPSSFSLLSARRPSWAPPLYNAPQDNTVASYRDVPTLHFIPSASQRSHPSTSPEDGGNFQKNLQIDMKDLVGDAVGNMSISPASRDIVLAARRGLFIIDLEAPLEIPRFLPQGGTWDVADVQWNPHRARAEYIVSTSSEKLLIWNLTMAGKSSIEHILHSHYRAITDINWHTFEPDTVSSVGIDSWLWSWDLREPRKPVMAGGTQVKWNRQDPNVLASSHMDEVLIWDRRKGSLPTTRIRAHNAKIYGIDWAHTRKHDIVTCSLDKTIKTDSFFHKSWKPLSQPMSMITTRYPRGETALEMWATGNDMIPVELFEGHTDVVKEFVWRKGGLGTFSAYLPFAYLTCLAEGAEYQLITWS